MLFRSVDQGEFELARAVEVERADRDAALIIDKLGNLRRERGNKECKEEAERAQDGFGVHDMTDIVLSANRVP